MSTDSNGRYQSRLFKFLQARSLQVAENCQRVVRQLKIATIWGVQVVLYPLYALLHNSNSPEALEQDNPSNHAQLPTAENENSNLSLADQSIARVLNLTQKFVRLNQRPRNNRPAQNRFSFKEWAIAVSQRTALSLPTAEEPRLIPALPGSAFILHPPLEEKSAIIRGIASELTTRSLVLTSTDNKNLDVLTRKQQQQLGWQIRREVAERPVWEKLATLQRTFSTQPFPPRQIWRQLLSSLKPGPLAIATPDPSSATPVLNGEPQMPQMESGNLAAFSEVSLQLGQRSWELLQLLRQRAHLSTRGESSPENNTPGSQQPDPANPLQIRAWIQAAIAHFFSPGNGALTLPTTDQKAIAPPLKVSPISPPTTPETTAIETWLTLRDLFGEQGKIQTLNWEPEPVSLPAIADSNPPTTPPALPASTVAQLSVLSNFQAFVETSLPSSAITTPELGENQQKPSPSTQPPEPTIILQPTQVAIATELVRVATAPKAIASVQPTAPVASTTPTPATDPSQLLLDQLLNQHRQDSSVEQPDPIRATVNATNNEQKAEITTAATAAVAVPTQPTTDIELTPEWLEAQAVSMGYVKHPLELILQRLDQIMLWLENSVIAIGKWLQVNLFTAPESSETVNPTPQHPRWQQILLQLRQTGWPKLQSRIIQLWQQWQQSPVMTEVMIPLGRSLQGFWQNTVKLGWHKTLTKLKQRLPFERVNSADPTDE